MDFQWSRNGPMFQEPRWISGYSNQHLILLVGEGNFSFAASLGNAFGAATNMVATSLDSKAELRKKYGPTAEWNTINLLHRGALVFHGFDACKMAIQQKNLLRGFQLSLFNCIIFNFPHAGFLGKESDAHVLRKHRELVSNFFANAKEMLLPGGQVHVRHKLGPTWDEWKLEELAHSTGLKLVGRVPFCLDQFPGYQNCRGAGFSADDSFRLGRADTFIFAVRDEEPPQIELLKILAPGSKFLKEKALAKKSVGVLSSNTPEPHQPLIGEAELKASSSQVSSWQQNIANDEARLGKEKKLDNENAKQVDKEKVVKEKMVQKAEQVEKQKWVEKEKQKWVEKEKQIEKQLEKQKAEQVEKQKWVEKEKQIEKHLEKQKAEQVEKQKAEQVEKQKWVEKEKQIEKHLEKQKAEQVEKQKAEQVEKQKWVEKEKQIEKQLEKQKAEQVEKQKAEQVEKQKWVEKEKQIKKQLEKQKVEQVEKQIKKQLEKQKVEQVEKQIKKQLEKQKVEQVEKQKWMEKEKQMEKQLEKQKAEQVEKQKWVEKEKQIEKQLEKQKAEQVEKQKCVEKEKQTVEIQLEKQKNVEKEKQVEMQVEMQKKLALEMAMKMKLDKEKMKTLETRTSASTKTSVANCGSVMAKKPHLITRPSPQVTRKTISAVHNVVEDLRLSDPMLVWQLKCLKEKNIRQGRGSVETPLYQVAADTVVHLEKKKKQLGEKKLRTLRMLKSALQNYKPPSNCHAANAPLPTPGENQIPLSRKEENAHIITTVSASPAEVKVSSSKNVQVWKEKTLLLNTMITEVTNVIARDSSETIPGSKQNSQSPEDAIASISQKTKDHQLLPNEVGEELVRVQDEVVDAPEKKQISGEKTNKCVGWIQYYTSKGLFYALQGLEDDEYEEVLKGPVGRQCGHCRHCTPSYSSQVEVY